MSDSFLEKLNSIEYQPEPPKESDSEAIARLTSLYAPYAGEKFNLYLGGKKQETYSIQDLVKRSREPEFGDDGVNVYNKETKRIEGVKLKDLDYVLSDERYKLYSQQDDLNQRFIDHNGAAGAFITKLGDELGFGIPGTIKKYQNPEAYKAIEAMQDASPKASALGSALGIAATLGISSVGKAGSQVAKFGIEKVSEVAGKMVAKEAISKAEKSIASALAEEAPEVLERLAASAATKAAQGSERSLAQAIRSGALTGALWNAPSTLTEAGFQLSEHDPKAAAETLAVGLGGGALLGGAIGGAGHFLSDYGAKAIEGIRSKAARIAAAEEVSSAAFKKEKQTIAQELEAKISSKLDSLGADAKDSEMFRFFGEQKTNSIDKSKIIQAVESISKGAAEFEKSIFSKFIGENDPIINKLNSLSNIGLSSMPQERTFIDNAVDMAKSNVLRGGLKFGLNSIGLSHGGIPGAMLTSAASEMLEKAFDKYAPGLANKAVLFADGVSSQLTKEINKFPEAISSSKQLPYVAGDNIISSLYTQSKKSSSKEEQYEQASNSLRALLSDGVKLSHELLQIKNVLINNGLSKELADNVVKQKLDIIKYIEEKRPKNPNPPAIFQTTKYQPSKSELNKWESVIEVATNPMAVIHHFRNGTLRTEHVQTFNDLYPGLKSQLKQKLYEISSDKSIKLDFKKKQNLTKLFGDSFGASLKGAARLQANFQPPQKSNIKKSSKESDPMSQATPGQKLAG